MAYYREKKNERELGTKERRDRERARQQER